MFVLLVVLVLFSIMYVSLFCYVWIAESPPIGKGLLTPPILERTADSVCHLSHLFTDITSCCDFFPLVYCGQSFGSDSISSWLLLPSVLRTDRFLRFHYVTNQGPL